jgi:DNA polymerase
MKPGSSGRKRKATPIRKNRGRILDLEDGWKGFITTHPSALLRARDEDREKEYARFLGDLRIIAKFARAAKAT